MQAASNGSASTSRVCRSFWSAEDDHRLMIAVLEHGERWRLVRDQIGMSDRTDDSIRNRYRRLVTTVKPSYGGPTVASVPRVPWTEVEDERIVSIAWHFQMDHCQAPIPWDQLVTDDSLPGRNPGAARNRYNRLAGMNTNLWLRTSEEVSRALQRHSEDCV